MKTDKHTPGLLVSPEVAMGRELDDYEIFMADDVGCLVATVTSADTSIEQARADARRLVACWNALDGIDPVAVPELVAACRRMADCMDEFLGCCSADEIRDSYIGWPETVASARAALATGEAGQ
jgi:hypothetical protein